MATDLSNFDSSAALVDVKPVTERVNGAADVSATSPRARFVDTNRGGRILFFDRYRFRINRCATNGNTYWKCKVKECRTTVVLDCLDELVSVHGQHNHPFNDNEIVSTAPFSGGGTMPTISTATLSRPRLVAPLLHPTPPPPRPPSSSSTTQWRLVARPALQHYHFSTPPPPPALAWAQTCTDPPRRRGRPRAPITPQMLPPNDGGRTLARVLAVAGQCLKREPLETVSPGQGNYNAAVDCRVLKGNMVSGESGVTLKRVYPFCGVGAEEGEEEGEESLDEEGAILQDHVKRLCPVATDYDQVASMALTALDAFSTGPAQQACYTTSSCLPLSIGPSLPLSIVSCFSLPVATPVKAEVVAGNEAIPVVYKNGFQPSPNEDIYSTQGEQVVGGNSRGRSGVGGKNGGGNSGGGIDGGGNSGVSRGGYENSAANLGSHTARVSGAQDQTKSTDISRGTSNLYAYEYCSIDKPVVNFHCRTIL